MSDDQPQDGGPAELLRLHDTMIQARGVQIAADLGIADELADGPRSAEDLAKATSCHPGALYRLMRMLAACGVFTEVEPGCFGLTPLGEHLRSDHPQSMRATLVCTERLFARVFADAAHSVRTGTATFPKTFGEPLFAYLQHHPEYAALFTRVMAECDWEHSAAVTETYDFSGARTVVDVAGGDGALLRAVLKAAPWTTGILLEQPHLAEVARERMVAEGVADRCTIAVGDFFQEVPAGGDVYLMKWIIHNWPDRQAVDILRQVRRAMSPDGRLVLVEEVVPTGDTPHRSKVTDFSMLLFMEGQERTAQEYAALLGDAGLRLDRVIETPTAMSLLEAVPIPDGHGA